jgi:predicted transcriptional regulator
MEVKTEVIVTIRLEPVDFVLLYQVARATKMPVEAVIMKAITEYVDRVMGQTQPSGGGG